MTASLGAHWNAALAGLQVKPDEMSSDRWLATLKQRSEVAGAVDKLLKNGPSAVPANIDWKAAITEVGTRPEAISDEDWVTFVKIRLFQVGMPKVEKQLTASKSNLHCDKCYKAHFMATKVKVNNVELEVYVSPTSVGTYLCREDYEKIGEPKLVEKNIIVSSIGMMDMAEGIAFLNASVSCMGGDWIEALGLDVNKTTCPSSTKCCPVDFLTLYAPNKDTSEKFEKEWLEKNRSDKSS